LGIQELFLGALRKRSSDLGQRVPDVLYILDRWESVLAALGRDYLELVGVLDWVTKFAMLEIARRDHGDLRWSDPRLAWMDIGYHSLISQDGCASVVPAQADRGKVVSDAEIAALVARPPEGGRDALRVGLLRQFADEIGTCDWHWVSGKDGTLYPLPDPTTGSGQVDLASLPTLAKAADALGLQAVKPGPSVILLVDSPLAQGNRRDDAGTDRPGEPGNGCDAAEDTQNKQWPADVPREGD
jgi:hypothetical protein